MSSALDFAKRIDSMDDEDREHFKEIINALSYCYTEEGRKALIIVESLTGMCETMTINCDDMTAYEMASATMQWFEFINTKDAPPKEKFN